MRLNTLSPAAGAKSAPKRVGRGIGSGLGKTLVAVTRVKNLVAVAVYVLASRVVKCHLRSVCLSSALPRVSLW